VTLRTFTTGEVAAYCGVSFRTVIRWIKRGQLLAYQLPGRGDNRVRAADLVDFMRNHGMPLPADLAPPSRPVLVVDDDEAMAASISRVLRRAGFDTEVATDGFAAGAMAEALTPAVIVLDLAMPGLGGPEVLKRVRALDSLRHTRILIVSAMPWPELEAALLAGADAALAKPFDTEDLLSKVRCLADPDNVRPQKSASVGTDAAPTDIGEHGGDQP